MKIFDPKLTGSIEILNTITGDVTLAGNLNVEGGLGGAVTGSATASYVDFGNIDNKPTLLSGSAQIASDISGSFTSLSSSLASELLKNTTDTLTGDLTVTGTLTAQDLHVQEVTSSIVYSSGSNVFGENNSDTQTFYGSNIFNGNIYISSSIPTIYLSDLQQQDWNISNDNGDIRFYQADDAITAMYISSSGNVGIGTSSPDNGLHVKDTNIHLQASNAKIKLSDFDNSMYLRMNNTGSLEITDSNEVNLVHFNKEGKVGIGTNSPAELLHLYSVSNSGPEIRFQHPSGSHYIRAYDNNWNFLADASVQAISIQNNGTTTFGANVLLGNTVVNPATGFADQSGIGLKESSTVPKIEVSSDDTGLSVGRTTTGGAGVIADFRYESNVRHSFGTATSYMLGNIGIGTTSPGSITSGGSILTLGTNGGLVTDDVVGAITFKTNDASFTAYHADGIYAQISSHADNANGASGRLSFYTAYGSDRGERMRITSLGSVGIGTTSPTSKLHSVITTAGDSALKLQDDTGSVFDFQCGIPAVTGDALLIKDTTLGYDYLTLRSGRVGIATNSPTKTLDVNGAIRSRDSFNLSDGTTQIGGLFKHKGITGAGSDNSSALFAETGLDIHFMTNGSVSTKAIIKADGNVGIGTTLPTYKLQVNGTGYINETLYVNGDTTIDANLDLTSGGRVKVSGGNTDQYYFEGARNGVGVTYRLYDNANNIYHDSWTSQVFRLNQIGGSGGNLIITGGNVGIGTGAPSAPLQVNGNQKWYTTNSDGNELRGWFVVGGSADPSNLRLYDANATDYWISLHGDGRIYSKGLVTNYGTGTGTYTQTTYYHDTSNGLLFEGGRTTNSSTGTGITWKFTWRGGAGTGGGVQLVHGDSAWSALSSDERLKTKTADVENGLDAITALTPIKYKWNNDIGSESEREITGFTAQNVQSAIPDAVFASSQDEELGDILTYRESYITAYLVKAVQELKAENDTLKARIEALEG